MVKTRYEKRRFILYFVSVSQITIRNRAIKKGDKKMLIIGKTPKEWRKEIGSKSLYYRAEIVIFLIGFILGSIIF